MNAVELQRILAETVARVFEDAVYALVEEEIVPCEPDTRVIESLVAFTGTYTGTIALEVEAAGAQSIANDLLGTEAPAVSAELNAAAVGELANIVAGRFMESWLPNETNYDIGIPSTSVGTHSGTRLFTEPAVCCTQLRTDNGVRIAAAVLLGSWA